MEDASELLGYPLHAMPVLLRAKLLRALGRPSKTSPKYFSSAEILALTQDRDFYDRAEIVLTRHWRDKRLKRGNTSDSGKIAVVANA